MIKYEYGAGKKQLHFIQRHKLSKNMQFAADVDIYVKKTLDC